MFNLVGRNCQIIVEIIIWQSAIQFIITVLLSITGRKGIGGTEQEWGHVTVRPHVHMFWWLYYTTGNVSHFSDRPLIIWLQGRIYRIPCILRASVEHR